MIEHTQTVYVSVAHRYWNTQWNEARNREVYGRNASNEGVGSNMALTLTLVADEGAQVEKILESTLQQLKGLCDHRCFFTDISGFENKPSTLETITVYLAEKLFSYSLPDEVRIKSLKVAENESLSCTIRAATGSDVLYISEKHLNLLCTVQASLNPETGLALSRGVLWQAVREVAPSFSEPAADIEAWGRALFAALVIKVKALCELSIDLGSQQSLRITSHT